MANAICKEGAEEVTAFLTRVGRGRNVSASPRNPAQSDLLFRYGDVFGIHLPGLAEMVAAKTGKRLPAVLFQAEARRLLEERDFARREIAVPETERNKGGVTLLPENRTVPLNSNRE
jgi:hypothetical protein